MRFERLVIEAGENTFTLDLHPQLTVIGGVGQIERDGLINEIVGALGNGRSGVHLEIVSDSGKRFAVFRPRGAKHRVIDIDAAADITGEFRDDAGQIDLLSRAGLDRHTARERMRFGPEDLISIEAKDRMVQALARVNQNELWVAAEGLRLAQRRLDEEAEAVGSSAEDAAVIERIEISHAEFEEAQARTEKYRKSTFLLGGGAALAMLPAAMTIGVVAVIPLVIASIGSVIASLVMWRRANAAAASETEALAEAGAQSYLGFHIQRVNGLLSSDQARRRLMQANEEHRDALKRWQVIAGDTDLGWAMRHRDAIGAAVHLRTQVAGLSFFEDGDGNDAEAAQSLAHSIVSRLTELRTLGPGSESFPALFDEPFDGLEGPTLASLLELLARSSEHQQVILMTTDDRVRQWARLEAMAGHMGVVEPSSANIDSEVRAISLR